MKFKNLMIVALAVLTLFSTAPVWANPSSGSNAAVMFGDIAFAAGGLDGRYIILANWAATDDYQINSIVKHDDKVWVALVDPAVGDEPGVSDDWTDLATPEPIPSHAIPNVGRLPTVTSTSPELVYLTHDYYEGGSPQGATVTIGFGNSLAGFSDGVYIQTVLGDIDEGGPLNAMIGGGDATGYNLQSIISFNQGWIDEFTSVHIAGTEYPLNPSFASSGAFERRIQGYPTGLTAATVTLNFERADGTFYYTDGSGMLHENGLYEKVGTPPTYHDLAPIEESHRDGEGSSACGDEDPPTDAAQVCVDDDGFAYFSTDRATIVEEEAVIESTEFTSDFWEGTTSIVMLNNNGENGEFIYHPSSDSFIQLKGTRATGTIEISGTDTATIPSGTVFDVDGTTVDVRTTADATISGSTVQVAAETVTVGTNGNIADAVNLSLTNDISGVTGAVTVGAFTGGTGDGLEIVTWTEAWTYVTSVDDSLPTATQTEHNGLRDDSVFLGEFSQTSDAAEDRDGYTEVSVRYFYIIHGDEGNMREITLFTPSMETEQEVHEWRGPVITIEDVHDVFEANSGDTITAALDSFRIGDNIYSTIVRPDPTTGDLREPTAAEWDFDQSLTVAWDGRHFQRVERYFEGAHSADAVFTEVQLLTQFNYLGLTNRYRWRGEIHNAAPNISQINGDFFFWPTGLRLREWDADRGLWFDRSTNSMLAEAIDYVGYHVTQDGALAHVTGDGDRVIYNRTPERARGMVRIFGDEDTEVPLGTVVEDPNDVQFHILDHAMIPAAGEIDVRARAVNGGTAGNITDQTVLTLPTAITGVTSMRAQGAFTRGDNVSGGRRLFTVSQFRAPDADEYRYRWAPIDDNVEGDVVFLGPNPDTGVLRDAAAEDYNADIGKSRTLAFDGVDLLRVGRRVTGATTTSGTWTTVADNTQIGSSAFQWRDTHYQDYLVENPQDGDVYYNRHTGFRERQNGTWSPAATSTVFASIEYIGSFLSQDEATEHATEDGQWALNVVGGVPRMQVLSSYSPADAGHYSYFWTPVNPPVVFPTLPPVPWPAEQDQILRWSTTSDAWMATQIVTGDTIDGIGTSGDPLVVSINDVTSQLQESIAYHSSGDLNYTTKGATVLEIFSTGPYGTCVNRIRVNIQAQGTNLEYTGRLYRLETNNNIATHLADSSRNIRVSTTGFQSFDFSECVTMPRNGRVGIGVSRRGGGSDDATFLRHGTEATNSPDQSYDDAQIDFNYLGWGEYEHITPAVGAGTRTHETTGNPETYGDIEIVYRRTFDHGHLVGDGNVDLDHLNDDVTARLLPGSPSDDNIARYDSATSAWVAEALPDGSSITLSDDDPEEVTLSVTAPGTSTEASRSDHAHETAANSVGSAEIDDFAIEDQDLDGGLQKELPLYTPASDSTYSNPTIGGTVHRGVALDVVGTAGSGVGDVGFFIWSDTATIDDDVPLAAAFNNEAHVAIHVQDGDAIRALLNEEVIAGTPMYILRTTNDWRLINPPIESGGISTVASDGTLTGDGSAGDPLSVANPFTNADSARLLPDSPTDDQIAQYNATTTAWEATTLQGAMTGTGGEILVDDIVIEWLTENGPSQQINMSRALTDTDDDLIFHIDWREWETTDPGDTYRDAGASMLAKHVEALTDLAPLLVSKTPAGGRNPIDRNVEILEARVNGAVTFRFPRSGTGGGLSDMRLIYVGDHIDDVNGALGEEDNPNTTDIPLISSAGVVVGRNYWIIGPADNPGTCGDDDDFLEEKVTAQSITDNDVTVIRAVDGTAIPTDCEFAAGADFVEDNKRSFILQSRNANQDNASVSFTLAAGGGGSSGTTLPDGTGMQMLRWDDTNSEWAAVDLIADLTSFDSVGDNDEVVVNVGASNQLRMVGLDDLADYIGTEAAPEVTTTVGGMVTGNTETGINVSYDTASSTLDFVVSEEWTEDRVGEMLTGNTETGIEVTYQDADGTIDFVVTGVGGNNAQTDEENTFTAPQTINAGADEPGLLVTTTGDGNDVLRLRAEDDSVLFFADATNLVNQTPFVFNLNPAGTQQAFWIRNGASGQAWFVLDGNLGGVQQPGIAFGPGGTETRDVELHRGGTDLLVTPDNLRVNGLSISGAIATTQGNLGIPTWARATGASGTVPTARLGTGTADNTTFLRGDNTWQTVTGGGSTTFTGLTDTPATITADQCVIGNAAGTALAFGACGTGTGATSFLGLTDTPAAFGTAGQHVVVNAAADGLEFAAAPAGGGGGILLQKYVVTSSANSTLAAATWTTLMSQSLTLAGATDRVFIDANVTFQFNDAGSAECDIRVLRGTTQVGAISGGAAYVQQEIHPVDIMVIDDSPGAGTYTYNIQVQDADGGSGTCQVNPQGTSSFAEIEVLGPNP